jgi:hypothetical protein
MEPNFSSSAGSSSARRTQASEAAAQLKTRYETVVRPALHRLAVNLRVWAPFFSTPLHRSTLVRFSSEDDRIGLDWKVVLPRQCWQCGQKSGLSPTEYEQAIRTFDNPVAVLGGGLGIVFVGLVLFLFMPGVTTFVIFALLAAVAAGIALLKSWQETVRLTMFSCSVHGADMRCPDMAIDDQKLHVFLPTAELAAAAADEAAARRKKHAQSRTMAAEGSASQRSFAAVEPVESPRSPAPSEAPIHVSRPEPVDLPPIRLAGDDDEPPAESDDYDTKQS